MNEWDEIKAENEADAEEQRIADEACNADGERDLRSMQYESVLEAVATVRGASRFEIMEALVSLDYAQETDTYYMVRSEADDLQSAADGWPMTGKADVERMILAVATEIDARRERDKQPKINAAPMARPE